MAAARRLHERLASESGLSAEAVLAILTHSKTNAIRELRSKRFTVLPRICCFKHSIVSGRSARVKKIRAHTFKSKPIPDTRRVSCRVMKQLERAALAAPSPGQQSQHGQRSTQKKPARTRAENAFYSNVVESIGSEEITADSIEQFVAALRAIIARDLRTRGVFVLADFVTLQVVDVKAKPAQYVNLKRFRSRIIQAKGAQRRVYGRVLASVKRPRQTRRPDNSNSLF